jgi:hypothetical protein
MVKIVGRTVAEKGKIAAQGNYSKDVWKWFNETAEGFGSKWESNWMKTWRGICVMCQSMIN